MTRKKFLLLVGAYAVLILLLIALCTSVINPALKQAAAVPCSATSIEQKEAA